MLQSAGCHFYESLSVVKGEGRVDGTAEIEYAMIRGAAGDMLFALFGAGSARAYSQSLHSQVRQHRIFWSELGRIAPPRTVHPNIPANAAPEPATPPVIPPPGTIKTTPADTASRMTPSGVPAVIPTPAGPPKKSMPPLSSRGEPLLAPKRNAPYALFNKTHAGSQPVPKGLGPSGGRLQSHHGLQQEWAASNLPGYDPKMAPTVMIETGKGFPHTTLSNLQNARRDARSAAGLGKWSSSIDDELGFIVSDFRQAGFGDDVVRQVLDQNYRMLDKLGIRYTKPAGF